VLPLEIELSQALPAAVFSGNGPGDRFVKEAAVQVASGREQPSIHWFFDGD
jgi:hypothetical protein